jgi:hypothetical protein
MAHGASVLHRSHRSSYGFAFSACGFGAGVTSGGCCGGGDGDDGFGSDAAGFAAAAASSTTGVPSSFTSFPPRQ